MLTVKLAVQYVFPKAKLLHNGEKKKKKKVLVTSTTTVVHVILGQTDLQNRSCEKSDRCFENIEEPF